MNSPRSRASPSPAEEMGAKRRIRITSAVESRNELEYISNVEARFRSLNKVDYVGRIC